MKLFDITVPLSNKTIPYEGGSKFELKQIAKTSPGNPLTYNLSRVNMSAHIGTHIDAPLHFAHNGDDIASLDLETLNGPARVLDLRGAGWAIGQSELSEKKIGVGNRVLLKTDSSGLYRKGRFSREFAYLTEDGAKYLRDRATKIVGIDYLSVDPWTEPEQNFAYTAHHLLLDSREDGIPPTIILEGIDLEEVEEGEYELVCMPLRIVDSDGSPARVVLKKN